MQQYKKNLGKVSLTSEGAWSREKSYEILSIVYDEHTQRGFISRQNVPQGIDLYNKEYWMPFNVSGYADNNMIILADKVNEHSIKSYTLEEAILSIAQVGRRPGTILGFYNENVDRLDIGGRWELWQFNDTNIYNWENVTSWQSLYYNYNKFVGWFENEDFLVASVMYPEIGCYAFVGSELNEATIYRCDSKHVWHDTTQHAWDYVKINVGGNVTIGENGNWFNNGVDTKIPATVKGENGKTPLIRNNNNVLEYSYDNKTWTPISDKIAAWFRLKDNKIQISQEQGVWTDVSDYIAAWFRWQATAADTQANNIGRLQISRDGKNWETLSPDISNNLHISRYIAADASLPTSRIAEGTIYAKGPTYAEDDANHDYPKYRLWVYAWKDNTLAWHDNGEFTSIAAGVTQTIGDSETEVMSQKAVTEKLSELGSEAVEYTNKQLDFIDREFDNETNKETEGDIVITDDDGNDVVKVSPKGVVVKDVSVSGNAFSLKQMLDYYDRDVEQNEEQDIVITDEKNEEVARFAPDGVYVKNLLIKKSNITLKQLIEFLSGDVEQSTEGDVIITDDEGNEVVRITPKGIIAKNIFKKSYFGAAQINPLGVGDSDKTIFNYDFYSLKSEDFEDNSVWNIVGNVLQSEYPGVAYKLKNKKTISIGEKTTYCRFIASEGTSFAVCFIAEGGYSYDSSLFSVSENSVNIHEAWVSTDELPNIRKSLPYNFISGKEYELIIRKDRHDNYLSVRDCQNGEMSNEIRTNQTAILGDLYNEFAGGRQQGKMCLVHISGNTPKIKNIRCVSKVVKPLLAIYGDSISEGDRVYNGQTYGDLLKEYLGTERVVISAISGTQVSNVIKRMTVELPILKPKFVMVSIGTNGGSTQEYFNQCKSIIESNGAIPIINVPPLGFSGLDAVRGYVSNLNCLSVRFDIATAKNNEISNGKNDSLFADGLHPNKEGHLAMFKRVFIDVIELLNY